MSAMMMELKLIILCLPSILLATNLAPDNKSILANTDWKKLWLETGQLGGSGGTSSSGSGAGISAGIGSPRTDNHLDSSDSTLLDDGEMMAHNTTVQLGGVAFLVCKVAGVDRNQISWIRRRDWHILTSGAQMYTNDERFAILHTPGSNTWTLQIKFVQRRDHGTYECQVSTPTGVISHFVNLQVVVPEAFILGSGELHVDMGSTINLVCIIEKSPQPPQYVYWQRNDRMINYDDSRRDISIETVPGPRTQSRLIIREPQINDSGNYTCSASNTEPASIYVFVSKGDNTAAISRRKTSGAGATIAVTMHLSSLLLDCLFLVPGVIASFLLTARYQA
ncbi:zwei Ig domain protein zig-8 isoform X2 [Toxorhynchites rutilus septentrionalis]|uniref:zwei Ig domain protein zig-8 isoform X2 n=1 Tax=Toxorhynchites rutilus septentrionalis TaxID=329112 RepID=UPI00247A1DA9|nr:zwei Ig domain protein zig-8 isoform X2 [Toxorhynchites rutilus septentrionalis]